MQPLFVTTSGTPNMARVMKAMGRRVGFQDRTEALCSHISFGLESGIVQTAGVMKPIGASSHFGNSQDGTGYVSKSPKRGPPKRQGLCGHFGCLHYGHPRDGKGHLGNVPTCGPARRQVVCSHSWLRLHSWDPEVGRGYIPKVNPVSSLPTYKTAQLVSPIRPHEPITPHVVCSQFLVQCALCGAPRL